MSLFSRCSLGLTLRLLGCILAFVCLHLGCQPSGHSTQQASQNAPKPVAEFEWVIKRLEHALESFSPSGSYGLRAKRELDYKLIPPSESQANYTAQVTITSKTYYKPTFQPREEKAEKVEPEVDPLAYDSFLNDDPLESPLENPDASFLELPIKEPVTQGAFVPMPSTGKIETFALAHLDGHWQLTTTIESNRARNWFNYALGR